MFLEERAAFGSLEEGDSSVLVFCILIIPSIMALSLFKDKVLVSKVDWQIMMEVTQVLMKMISASLPSAEQSNDMTMRILERALEAFDGLWNTCGFFSTVTLPWGVFINLRDSFPSGEVKWSEVCLQSVKTCSSFNIYFSWTSIIPQSRVNMTRL